MKKLVVLILVAGFAAGTVAFSQGTQLRGEQAGKASSTPPEQRQPQGKDTGSPERAQQDWMFLHAASQALRQPRRKVQNEDLWQMMEMLLLIPKAAELERQGYYQEAEALWDKMLTCLRKVAGEEDLVIALCYHKLACSLNAQGRYPEAEKSYRKSLEMIRKILGETHYDTVLFYSNLAGNLWCQKRYQEAGEYFGKALAIDRKVLGEEHRHTAADYNNVATTLATHGRYRQAEELYRKALAIQRKVLGEEHTDTAATCTSLASNQWAQGRYQEAEDLFGKALDIFRKTLGEEHPTTASSYTHVAGYLAAQGRYREAEAFYRHGADSFLAARLRIAGSGLDRVALTAEESPLPHFTAVLARNGKPLEAWQRYEQGLARGTWDDLSARLRRSPQDNTRQTEIVTRLERIDQALLQIGTVQAVTPQQQQQRQDLLAKRLKAQEELADFTRQLVKTYGPVAGQVFSLTQIQAALPSATALLGFIDLVPTGPVRGDPDGEHWAVLLRSAGPPLWQRLRGIGPDGAWTDEDNTLPGRLRQALQSPRADWQKLAQQLRQQRLEPLAGHLAAGTDLPAVRQLVVLPSPALAGIPLEVSAENLTVSYGLSGTVHAHLHSLPRPSTQGLLALGNPIYQAPSSAPKPPLLASRGDDDWKALPGTRLEVESLRQLFGNSSPVQVLLGTQASEQRLAELARKEELGQYRYVHLATHGQVDDSRALRSAVILSRDALPDPQKQLLAGLPIYDGRLTAEEMLRKWQLNCDLVTLSACQTALGKYERGEGFVGFAQALLLCGSRAVCLSLWKVDDTATALLMTRFYENLLGKRTDLKKPLDRAAALQEAKKWLRDLRKDQVTVLTANLSSGGLRGTVEPLRELVEPVKTGTKAERPFSHPYYWAAFVLIGNPE